METVEFVTSLSFAECVRRLEALHEPAPTFLQSFSPSTARKSSLRFPPNRTEVQKILEDAQHAEYHLERQINLAESLLRSSYGYILARATVTLEAESDITTRVSYIVTGWNNTSLINLALLLGVGFFVIFMGLMSSDSESKGGVFCSGIFVALCMIVGSLQIAERIRHNRDWLEKELQTMFKEKISV